MLSPSTLEQLPNDLIDLINELQTEIIRSVSKKISKANYLTPAAEWQLYKAQMLQSSTSEVNKLIAQYTGLSRREVKALYTEACKKAIANDAKIYRMAGKDASSFFRSVAFSNSLRAGIKNANGLMKNITRSMVQSSRATVTHLMDKAYVQVLSGAFSPQEAIYSAVKELADNGIQSVTYPSGKSDWADVAVRRAVLTALGQTTGRIQLDLAAEMDCDLVEVTSHGDARPSHAEWQGQVYSISGKHKKYPPLSRTGYGTGDGLKGWNCRHDFYPFFEGISERASFPINKEENDREYAATQRQRAIERSIRSSKRGLAALDSSIQSTDDESLKEKLKRQFDRKSNTLKKQEARLAEHCKASGLLPRPDRTRVVGFGKSVSQKAVHGNKRYKNSKTVLTDSYSNAIMKLVNGQSPFEPVLKGAENKVPTWDIFNSKSAKTDEENAALNKLNIAHADASRKLLKYVRADGAEAGTEYAMIYDENMRIIENWKTPKKGVVGHVPIEYDSQPFHAFHNHGSNATLSFSDVDGFSKNSNMKSLTAQGNNGKNKFTVFKTPDYDEDGYCTFLHNISEEPFFTIGKRQFTLSNKVEEDEFFAFTEEQKEQYVRSYLAKCEEYLVGGEKYGVRYIFKKT